MKKNSFLNKCIRHIHWLLDSIFGYFKYRNKIDSETYVFISHNGDSSGGAPVVLFELLNTIKNDKKVVLLCEKPGGIFDLCKKNHIDVYCTYLLSKAYMKKMLSKNVKCIVLNTLAVYKNYNYLAERQTKIPVIWWIHEENRLVQKYGKYVSEHLLPVQKVLCVSKNVELNLLKICPFFEGKTQVFFYGCTDQFSAEKTRKQKNDKFVISVIGRICNRKNQKQIVEAYELLDEKTRSNIYIDFIAGSYEPSYLSELKDMMANHSNICIAGAVPREKMSDVYYKSDLIVCCSVDDPLPVVVTEAMMFRTPFITSSETGQYYLVQDSVNGFTYESNSTSELAEKILTVYRMTSVEKLTEQGRAVYNTYFTPQQVKKQFYAILEETTDSINN